MERRQAIPPDMQQNTPFYSNYLIQNTKGSNFNMKTMKKIFALTLALMLVFSLALTANAVNNVTIKNAQQGATYNIYRMLEVQSQSGDNIVYKIADGWSDFFNQDDVNEYFDIKTDGVIVAKDNFNDAAAATVAGLAATYASGHSGLKCTDVTATEGTTTVSLEDGYYLMTSTLGEKNTLVNINGTSVTIREKNTPTGLPDIEKEIGDNGTGYKVGDTFNSTIKVTCDEGQTKYTVVDTMTGLELVSEVDDFEVKYNGVVIPADIAINDAKNGFEIEMEFATPTKAYDEITIEYTVKVTEAGVNEITNKAEIEENPGVSDEDKANNGGFELKKQDENNVLLDGAKFKLYSDADCTTEVVLHNAGGYYRPVIGQEQGEEIVAKDGSATIKGLGEGIYYLKETEAPAGYVMDYTEHTVTIDLDATSTVQITVTNVKGEELPETGGMGTTLFYALGGLMVAAAAVLLITKKRMSAM